VIEEDVDKGVISISEIKKKKLENENWSIKKNCNWLLHFSPSSFFSYFNGPLGGLFLFR
jgi:hypothetical protein